MGACVSKKDQLACDGVESTGLDSAVSDMPEKISIDALKACKAEIVKAPTPKAMTETPLEGDAMMILKAKMMAGK